MSKPVGIGRQVMDVLDYATEAMTAGEIAAASGVDVKKIRDALKHLMNKEVVVDIEPSEKGGLRTYIAAEPAAKRAAESQPANPVAQGERQERAWRVDREGDRFVLTLLEHGEEAHQSSYHTQQVAESAGNDWINQGMPEEDGQLLLDEPEIQISPNMAAMYWDKAEDIRQEALTQLKAYALSLGYEAGVPANAGTRIMTVCKTSMLEATARKVVFEELLPELKLEILTDYEARTARAKEGEVVITESESARQSAYWPLQHAFDGLEHAIEEYIAATRDPVLRDLITARDALVRAMGAV
jgi:hypothetical protein